MTEKESYLISTVINTNNPYTNEELKVIENGFIENSQTLKKLKETTKEMIFSEKDKYNLSNNLSTTSVENDINKNIPEMKAKEIQQSKQIIDNSNNNGNCNSKIFNIYQEKNKQDPKIHKKNYEKKNLCNKPKLEYVSDNQFINLKRLRDEYINMLDEYYNRKIEKNVNLQH